MLTAQDTLTTPGRAALYEYMVEALSPYARRGLDKQAILNHSDITDDDLRIMVDRVAEVSMESPKMSAANSRMQLVERLSRLIDRAALRPEALVNDAQATIRSNSTDEVNPDTLRHQTRKQHNMAQGRSGRVSQQVLRSARQGAGWVPISRVAVKSVIKEKTLKQLVDRYISERIDEGMSSEEAEKHMARHYIAVTLRYKTEHRGGAANLSQWTRVVDRSEPTKRWVDISPEALDDFSKELKNDIASNRVDTEISAAYDKIGAPYDEKEALALARKLLEKESKHLAQERGIKQGSAYRHATRNYIHISTTQRDGEKVPYVTVSARAQLDIQRSIMKMEQQQASTLMR